MDLSIDITAPRSGYVDYEYARMHANPPHTLGDELAIDFWGLLLRTREAGHFAIPDLAFSCTDHSVFIAGWSRMRFEQPTHLSLSVALYEDSSGHSFRRNANGEDICLEYSIDRSLPGSEYTYKLGGYSLWPRGDGNLSVRAIGEVTIEFRTEDCMTAEEASRRMNELVFPE